MHGKTTRTIIIIRCLMISGSTTATQDIQRVQAGASLLQHTGGSMEDTESKFGEGNSLRIKIILHDSKSQRRYHFGLIPKSATRVRCTGM
jgi:hypothetical protein